ncbi:type II toxin-antitoxin system VapC family toxin [Acinetobacter baumannii]|uniref:type II toxin-antitoxin system VapC family toxin n=1 Tax=Acinetobacter baumannii TaxID=470 RepID=UPI003F7A8658
MSQIFDIKITTPDSSDRYFVDTNVWYWFTYCGSNRFAEENAREYQLIEYPKFIEKILDIGAKIITSPLVYTELANLIERNEYQEYLSNNRLESYQLSRKAFREITSAREKVLKEIKTAWDTICGIAPDCLELKLDLETANAAHAFMSRSMLDPYDAIFIHFLNSHNIKMLLSDDGDMMTTDIEEIFTANNRFITRGRK